MSRHFFVGPLGQGFLRDWFRTAAILKVTNLSMANAGWEYMVTAASKPASSYKHFGRELSPSLVAINQ